MIDELQRAMELATQQSEEEQRHIAALILQELEDSQWEASDELAAATAEAHAEVARGEVMEFEDYDRARRARGQQAQ
jgi:hypothetical protein